MAFVAFKLISRFHSPLPSVERVLYLVRGFQILDSSIIIIIIGYLSLAILIPLNII